MTGEYRVDNKPPCLRRVDNNRDSYEGGPQPGQLTSTINEIKWTITGTRWTITGTRWKITGIGWAGIWSDKFGRTNGGCTVTP